jgi:hypothetical protein
MANALVDGMNPPDYVNIGTSNNTGSYAGSPWLAPNSASGAVVSKEFPVCYTGSPYKANCAIQVGTASLSAGSTAWVNFGTPFAAAPIVVCNSLLTVDSPVCPVSGTIGVGSFQAMGKTASDWLSWVAIGSGRV